MSNTPDAPKIRSNRYLYLAVFTSGMTTLAVELSATRLLGSVFGTSNLVWANVIGLILVYLTAGYFIGGRWADRSPYPRTFYRIIMWGAFLSALIPLVARPVLRVAGIAMSSLEVGPALGSFVIVVVLFSAPVTLLGTVSPFAIRLAVLDVRSAGKTSGHIYAISTLGSLIGTFLPVLLLIPTLGTIRTFLLFGGVLYAVAFVGLWRDDQRSAIKLLWMPVVVGVLAALVLSGPLRPPPEGFTLLYEDESPYNYIQVQESASGTRYLLLNEGQGVHSEWNQNRILFGGTWDYFLTAPYFNVSPYTPQNVDSLLIIGLAAGTIARQYTAAYGNIPIDGVEIDPDIVQAGAKFFGMNEQEMPNLTVYVQDGRYVLYQLHKRYSVVGIDAYRPPYIPWQLTTVEFFQQVRDHLEANGVVAINVGRTNTDRRLVDAMASTLREVFPSVHAMDVPSSFNTILVATVQPTDAQNLSANLAQLPKDASPLLREMLTRGTTALVPVQYSDTVFTDDRAPVETLVDSLVLNFLLNGDTSQLRGAGD